MLPNLERRKLTRDLCESSILARALVSAWRSPLLRYHLNLRSFCTAGSLLLLPRLILSGSLYHSYQNRTGSDHEPAGWMVGFT